MAAISTLLNPEDQEHVPLPSPVPSNRRTPGLSDVECTPCPPAKKQKLAKDAAVFTKHEVRPPIRYSPWEDYDAATHKELEAWSVYPVGQIAEYRRHIPYSGGKSDFEKKTGRKAFEVYQYTFKIPTSQEQYVVMWDYSIGLVRITPFFKCLKYAKTVPSRVIDDNNGLRDLCFSITGGALAAQGYWMPFEAAKAVAATFCHSIRFALSPLFGPDFIEMCIDPNDDKFAKMRIDPNIIRRCAKRTEEYFMEETRGEPVLMTPGSYHMTSTPEPVPRDGPVGLTSREQNKPGRWRAVNSDSEDNTVDDDAANNGYLPSPSSTTANEPARSAPQNIIRLPMPTSTLVAASSLIHGRERSWSPAGDVGPERGIRVPLGLPSNSDFRTIMGSHLFGSRQSEYHGERPMRSEPAPSYTNHHATLARSHAVPPSSFSDGFRGINVDSPSQSSLLAEHLSLENISRDEFIAAWTLVRFAREDARRRL